MANAFNRQQIIEDVAVMLGLLGIIILLIWVHFASPIISIGTLSSTTSRLITSGVTIAATIFTGIVSSRVQHGFIRSLENRLHSIGQAPIPNDESTPAAALQNNSIQVKKLDQEWRGILRIDTLAEKFHNYQTFSIFLTCGLVTTSIVTSLTPTLTSHAITYNVTVADPSLGLYSNSTSRPCVSTNDDVFQVRSTYAWTLENRTRVCAANDGECPPSFMTELAVNINRDNADDHVYSQSGVAVERSAIGAPASLFNSVAFNNMSSIYGHALMNTTQCVPVMTSNPVRCQKGGSTNVVDESSLNVTSGTVTAFGQTWPGGAAGVLPYVNRNLTTDSVMGTIMMTYNNLTRNETGSTNMLDQGPGKVVIVLGALTDPTGSVPFAFYLADAVGDPDKTAGTAGNSTYTVTCAINPRNVFEYRRVTLNLRALGEARDSNLAQYLSGGESCTPEKPTIGDKMFATAGIAAHQLVRENVGVDGYFTTIARLAGFNRKPPYAFPDSRNPLEDVLGLVSALAVSIMPLSDEGTTAATGQATDAQGEVSRATAFIEVSRLGSDSWESLLLLLPPVGSLVAMICIFVLTIRRGWAPGGRIFQDRPDKRPTLYTSESIRQLIALGRKV